MAKNEFEVVTETTEKIFNILNEAPLSGMTILFMMRDITAMIEDQLRNQQSQGTQEKAK